MGVGEGVGEGQGPDLENRDPQNINNHIRVAFEDVLAEPDGIHSIDCVWRSSFACFNCTKNCCYKCLTLFCGSCMAMCWGLQFACIAFNHIWCLNPRLRACIINCSFYQRCWGTVIQCILAPICETCGLFFSRIQVLNLKTDVEKQLIK